MASKPKKPKLLKYPKRPKESAGLATWKRFEQRCIEVDKKNAHKAKEYNNKLTEIIQVKALKEKLKHKYGSRTAKTVHLKAE